MATGMAAAAAAFAFHETTHGGTGVRFCFEAFFFDLHEANLVAITSTSVDVYRIQVRARARGHCCPPSHAYLVCGWPAGRD